jgi:hypothetical protein
MTKRYRRLQSDAIKHKSLELRKIHCKVDWRLLIWLTILQHVNELSQLQVLQFAAIRDQMRP